MIILVFYDLTFNYSLVFENRLRTHRLHGHGAEPSSAVALRLNNETKTDRKKNPKNKKEICLTIKLITNSLVFIMEMFLKQYSSIAIMDREKAPNRLFSMMPK